MDWDTECMCERRIKDDSRILACGAIKMELPRTGMRKTEGRSRFGEEDRDSLLNMSRS